MSWAAIARGPRPASSFVERVSSHNPLTAEQHRVFRETSGERDSTHRFGIWQDKLWAEYAATRGLDAAAETRDAHQEPFTAWVRENAPWQGRVADARQREMSV